MRKKSHISLANYLIESKGMECLGEHKSAFYIGSLLPDCIPSFITRRHTIEDTFDILRTEIEKITENYDISKGISRYFCRHLGVITHYLADYFTYPHNSIYPGTIKEHCFYENDLKKEFRKYVKTDIAQKTREQNGVFRTVDDICKFILDMHNEYLKAIKEVKQDCVYIVNLCHRVVDAVLQIIELAVEKAQRKHIIVTV